MSMLAERKRKQKWSLNPRGKDWAQDANKFGQKMLEKMGWQQGRGLGAKEDGITEHVKVSYKNDSKGMGFKETNDQWTEHESNFTALLESLSGTVEKPDVLKLQSLEKKSETSRARVHYHKFTRGKDLSRYSEKDLANIFGKKSLYESKDAHKEPVKNDNENPEKESKFLVNAGSMRDYFKKKLPTFGKSNGYVVGSNGVLKKGDSESDTDARPSFNRDRDGEDTKRYVGFGFKSEVMEEQTNKNPTFVSYVNGGSSDGDRKKKKKRKVEEIEDATPKKKAKKDVEQRSTIDDLGLSNPAFNPMCTPVKVEKHVLTTIEETFSEEIEAGENSVRLVETKVEVYETKEFAKSAGKKKKKKSLGDVDMNAIQVCNGENSIIETGIEDIGGEKKKKKRKRAFGINDSAFEETSLECNVNDSNCGKNSFEAPVATRKKKKEELCVENPGFDEFCETSTDFSVDFVVNPYEVKVSPKKKKKKGKSAMENPSFNGSSENSRCENNSYEVKLKKKKRKAGRAEDSSSAEDISQAENSREDRKKKKRKEDAAVENPCFNVSIEAAPGVQIEENPYEVKKKKKRKAETGDIQSADSSNEVKRKKKKVDEEIAIVNPAFNDSVEDDSEMGTVEDSLDAKSVNNAFEVERKKKKKGDKEIAMVNPAFNDSADDGSEMGANLDAKSVDNAFEVERKKKKKGDKEKAIVNPAFNDSAEDNSGLGTTEDSLDAQGANNAFEVERKRKKSKKKKGDSGFSNPALALDASHSEINENVSLNIEESDLMLNIVTTPVPSKLKPELSNETFSITKVTSVRRRKSVRFSDITQERIIPNNDDLRNLTDIENRNELFDINAQVLNSSLEDQTRGERGLDNFAFDKLKNRVEENVESISKTLDRYQAEIENDINEKKLERAFGMDDVMVGDVGNPHGENERLGEGTRLKFKYANFTSTRTPIYHMDKVGPKKGYRHLIKGDIVVKFNNTNLHEIGGYGVKRKSTVV